MTTKYAKTVSTTSQTEKILGSDQKQNNAGGFSFEVDDWMKLNRFLILGSEGGTYYATEHKLTLQNAENAIRCIRADGKRVVDIVVNISENGRAPKNDPSIFVLALVTKFGNDESRSYAYRNLNKVCRIGTHLFQFVNMTEQIGKGNGIGLMKAIARWYNEKPVDKLALQVIKYRDREGYSHRDILRLAHVKNSDKAYNDIYSWISWNGYKNGKDAPVSKNNDGKFLSKHQQIVEWVNSNYKDGQLITNIHPLINAFEKAQKAKTASEIVPLITEFNLPREVVPTELLNDPEVWKALLPKMPLTAMIRNLATMTRIGVIKPLSDETSIVVNKLADVKSLHDSRVHPIQILSAFRTYSQGHGFRSDKVWTPVQQIVDALDKAFYDSFNNVMPTGKRIMLSLDVSGSMGMGEIAGVPGLTPRDASGAMAMVTAKIESNVIINGFTSGNSRYDSNTLLTPLSISGKNRLDSVIKAISDLPFGGTDCSLPMVYALNEKIPVDAFVIYTDSETYAGKIHPVKALTEYRKKMNIPAKLIVVGMIASEFSIADPNDNGMLDVVGFDSSTPSLMNEFIKE